MNGTDPIRVSPKFRAIGETYEPQVWKHFMSSLNTGDVIADVGAHIGLYTVALARRLAPNGRVIAFEPHEQNFNALTYHVKMNGVRTVVETVRAGSAYSTEKSRSRMTRTFKTESLLMARPIVRRFLQ